jgi:hypothetical protein
MPVMYDTILHMVQQSLSETVFSRMNNIAIFLTGLMQSMTGHLGAIARAAPLETTQQSKKQRLRRFLDNGEITQVNHFQPIVQGMLDGLKNQRVFLAIDRVLLNDKQNVLVVSLCFRRRSVPLTWKVLWHRGSSSLKDQQKLLREGLDLLPEGVRVTVLGDSEFRSVELCAWAQKQDCHAQLSISSATVIYRDAGDRTGQTVKEMVGDSTEVIYCTDVYVTKEHRYGPVNLYAWWDKDKNGDPIVRAVMTDRPATWRTKQQGGQRMWIETVFGDWQGRGFRLDQTGITNPKRFERLLILVVLGYLWFVSIGRWVVKRGYRRLIDDGKGKSWTYSLFQLGVGWKERLQSYGKPFPLLMYIYV